jgi:hypothetical protein
LSNEEKTNDYENFEKWWVVEKRGAEETKSMPHTPVVIHSEIGQFFSGKYFMVHRFE